MNRKYLYVIFHEEDEKQLPLDSATLEELAYFMATSKKNVHKRFKESENNIIYHGSFGIEKVDMKEDEPELVLGYYIDKGGELQASDVFIALNNPFDIFGNLTAYAPMGQHQVLDPEYLKECQEITCKEYRGASKGFYTPKDYIKIESEE